MRFSWVAPSNNGEPIPLRQPGQAIFRASRFYFYRKNPKPLYFLTFLQIRLKLQCNYSIIFNTIKSNRIQEIVI